MERARSALSLHSQQSMAIPEARVSIEKNINSLHMRHRGSASLSPSPDMPSSPPTGSVNLASGLGRRMLHGARFRLRLSVACNIILLALLFFTQGPHHGFISSSLMERWIITAESFDTPPHMPLSIPQEIPPVEQASFQIESVKPEIPLVGGSCSMCAVGPEICAKLG